MEIVFNLTQADFQTFQSHLRSRPPKPARLVLYLGYCLGIGLGVLFTLQSVIEAVSDDLSGAITNTLLVLSVICWLVLAWWLNSGAYKKWLSQFLGEYHLIVSAAGIHSIGPHGQRFASWPEIRALEETEAYVFIYLTRNVGHVIPKAAYADFNTLKHFLDLIRAYWMEHPENRGAMLSTKRPRTYSWLRTAGHGLLVNLGAGLRLATFRSVGLYDFKIRVSQLLLLVSCALLLSGLTDYVLAAPGPPNFNVYGLTAQAALLVLFLLSAITIAGSLANTKSALHLLVMLSASQFFIAVTYVALYAALRMSGFETSYQRVGSLYLASLVWMLSVVYRTVRILYHQSQVAALFLVSLFTIFNYAPVFYLPRGSMLFYPTEPEETHENKFPRIDVETTFYRQPQLLQEASARLLPERPGITDLYFLGFAGEADENVFSHEIRYARDLFDQRFDTQGRSMVLINHTETVDNTPLANVHNLELALRRIAERMNLEEDMVFIFLSSHGSKDHRLSVEFWPFNLNDLAAATLKELLDRSGIRNRVIVISACYSGGFLDVLKDDYSLIMTAASRDRQSFGCGDTAVFTYFGEAYFVQALTREYSFIKAFYAAKRSIEQREANENKTPSLPQIHVGTAIAKKLEALASRRNTRTVTSRP